MLKIFIIIFFSFFNLIFCQEKKEEDFEKMKSDALHHYFEQVIKKYELQDTKLLPDTNQIVAVGSSSIRFWEPTLNEDLKPLKVFSRSLGGGNLSDVLYYADKLIVKYKPRAILIYAGENDLVNGLEPTKVLTFFKELVLLLKKNNSEIRVYFISIKPSVGRWYLWDKMKLTNQLIENFCKEDKNICYIDVANQMLNENGKPKPELFRTDTYHLSDEGYKLWTSIIKPILIDKEAKYDKNSNSDILNK